MHHLAFVEAATAADETALRSEIERLKEENRALRAQLLQQQNKPASTRAGSPAAAKLAADSLPRDWYAFDTTTPPFAGDLTVKIVGDPRGSGPSLSIMCAPPQGGGCRLRRGGSCKFASGGKGFVLTLHDIDIDAERAAVEIKRVE